MLKRLLVLVVAVMLIGGSSGVTAQEATPAVPEGPYLPVKFSRNMGDLSGTSWEIGNGCSVGEVSESSPFWLVLEPDFQIIVRDEQNRIIAVEDAPDGEVEESILESDSDWYCKAQLNIELPPASFYTVYFNDQFVRAYKATDFPFEDGDTLYVNFEK